MKRARFGVIALALAATGLTAEASAQTPAEAPSPSGPAASATVGPAPSAPPAAMDAAIAGEPAAQVAPAPTAPAIPRKPLRLRQDAGPEAPLALAPEKTSDDWWIKALAGALIVGAGAFAFRKKGLLDKEEKKPKVEILERMSLGVRSELVVVGVDGQRLLLGVTAGGIQRLAMLSEDTDTSTLVADDGALGASFERLLARSAPVQASPVAKSPAAKSPAALASELEQEIAGAAASYPGMMEASPTTDESPELSAPRSPRRRVAYTIDEATDFEDHEVPEPRSSRPRRRTAAAAPAEPRRTMAARPASSASSQGGGQAAALQALLAQRRRAS